METITRRAALQKIAKLSLATAAVPLFDGLTGCCFSRQAQLNVVLHGLYVLNFTKSAIEMLTPDVEGHVYLAGNWEWKPSNLIKSTTYELHGVTPNSNPPHLNLPYNILFPKKGFSHSVNSNLSRHIVNLPYPQSVRLLRVTNDGENQEYADKNTLIINQLSLCQVLTYHVPDWRELKLTNLKWNPRVDQQTCMVNLHFWAEPLYRVPFQHAECAYDKLSQILSPTDKSSPLNLKLGTDKSSPLDPMPGAYGLPREHEQGLAEWYSGGEGSHPTNCSTVMVDGTQGTTARKL